MGNDAAHHTAPAPAAPPRLVRGGEKRTPLLFKEGWHAKRDGVVREAPSLSLPPPARCAGYYAHEARIDNVFGWRRRCRGGVVVRQLSYSVFAKNPG